MTGHRWGFMVRPRWLAWHLIAIVTFFGMLWLGDWQLRRAESGNELSWAYAIEWPLFAICGVYFYIRTIREELHVGQTGSAASAQPAAESEPEAPEAYAARLRSEVAATHGRRHGWR
jgi:hypothetical protein